MILSLHYLLLKTVLSQSKFFKVPCRTGASKRFPSFFLRICELKLHTIMPIPVSSSDFINHMSHKSPIQTIESTYRFGDCELLNSHIHQPLPLGGQALPDVPDGQQLDAGSPISLCTWIYFKRHPHVLGNPMSQCVAHRYGEKVLLHTRHSLLILVVPNSPTVVLGVLYVVHKLEPLVAMQNHCLIYSEPIG